MDKTIGVISVASPCRQSWESMTGDANVRFCGACEKNVYQLDNLTTDEVRKLIVAKEGKLCWRFYVRRDGTVLTKDCPVGIRRVRQRMFAAIATACAMVLSSAALILRSGGFWDSSQCLGSMSQRLGESGLLPVPFRVGPTDEGRMAGGAPPPPQQRMLGGKASFTPPAVTKNKR